MCKNYMETWTGFDLPDESEIDSDSIFISVEHKPEFPGGLSGLYSYFKNKDFSWHKKPSRKDNNAFAGNVLQP